MRTVLQRAKGASVTVDGRTVGKIDTGLVAFVAIEQGDGIPELEWMAHKLLTLRLFSDDGGRLNQSLQDIAGAVLLVPNFTVAGSVSKGTRPDFGAAAAAETAGEMFEAFVRKVHDTGVQTETGTFGADMLVSVDGDGPVTLMLERRAS